MSSVTNATLYVCVLGTNWGSSEGSVVTVLLPGAVEAQHEILEEGVGFVEDRKADDVDSLVHHIIQPQQREFLRHETRENRKG